MTHSNKKRPSVLLVNAPPLLRTRIVLELRAGGFDVVTTRSRAAAVVYSRELMPDLVLTDPATARVLSGCYPDGPLWIRSQAPVPGELGGFVVLRGAHADPQLRDRITETLASAHLAA